MNLTLTYHIRILLSPFPRNDENRPVFEKLGYYGNPRQLSVSRTLVKPASCISFPFRHVPVTSDIKSPFILSACCLVTVTGNFVTELCLCCLSFIQTFNGLLSCGVLWCDQCPPVPASPPPPIVSLCNPFRPSPSQSFRCTVKMF
jgi:hypothetical protein